MNQPFQIFPITEEDVTKIAAAPSEPHHHDYEELIVAITGRLEHFIDFKSTTIKAPFVSFVTRGKIHRALPKLKNEQKNIFKNTGNPANNRCSNETD